MTLKQIPALKWTVMFFRVFQYPRSVFATLLRFGDFRRDWSAYGRLPANPAFSVSTADLYPRLFDKTATTRVDPVYFYQDAWVAGKIFERKPVMHTDVASHLPTLGIISQFVPTTMVDIRPPEIALTELTFVKGSILSLPFNDGEISSLSSICVIEHIGLGRYGDPLDQFGSEKAAQELVRVLAKGGDLYVSVPVDTENRVYFNAHRAFTPEYVRELFEPLTLKEEKYIYGMELFDSYDPARGFGTGLYHFTKI